MKHYITDLPLFAEAWLCLGIARLMLVFLPFRKIAPLLSKKVPSKIILYGKGPECRQRISIAIRRAARWSPWRTKCFEQALAGKIMLTLRKMSGIVSFGINKQGEDLNAHAWLESEGHIITGGKNLDHYIVIARFKS